MAARDQVDDDLGVGGRLEQRALADQVLAHRDRVGEVAVVRDGQPAEREVGIERLYVAQQHVAGRGVSIVADGGVAGQLLDRLLVAEIVGDVAQAAMRVEAGAVEADDPRRRLAAVLQRVQAERHVRRCVIVPVDPEHAALLVQLIVVERVGGGDRFQAGVHGHWVPLIRRSRSRRSWSV